MSEKAPELAGLLRRALRDGFISSDVAQALLLAAQNINEDVVINLMAAGQNINEEVAEKFICANKGLGDTARDLDRTLSSLREMVVQLSGPQRGRNLHSELEPPRIVNGNSRQIAVAGTMASSRNAGRWRFIGMLICGSVGAGLLAAIILMRSYLGGYAVFAGVIVLLFAAILQFRGILVNHDSRSIAVIADRGLFVEGVTDLWQEPIGLPNAHSAVTYVLNPGQVALFEWFGTCPVIDWYELASMPASEAFKAETGVRVRIPSSLSIMSATSSGHDLQCKSS